MIYQLLRLIASYHEFLGFSVAQDFPNMDRIITWVHVWTFFNCYLCTEFNETWLVSCCLHPSLSLDIFALIPNLVNLHVKVLSRFVMNRMGYWNCRIDALCWHCLKVWTTEWWNVPALWVTKINLYCCRGTTSVGNPH